MQVCVWGRCEGVEGVTVDVSWVRVRHYPGAIVGPDPFSLPLTNCLHDPAWLASGVGEEVRERGGGGGGGVRGVMSEAVAIAEMTRQWIASQNTENDTRFVQHVSKHVDGLETGY